MGLSGKDSLNLLFMLGTSALIAYGPMAHEQYGPGVAFTYHPFLMGLGFSLFITLGFWMFNYEDLPGEWIDTRASRRKVHAICQVTGALCIVAGYAAVVQAHSTKGAALFQVSNPPMGFSSGPGWLRLIHVIVGYCAIGVLVVQVFLGLMKYKALSDADEDGDAFSLHQQIGVFLYFCGLGNMMLGVWLWEAWSLPLRCIITLTLLTSLAFGPRWDGSLGFLSGAEEEAPRERAARSQGQERSSERRRGGGQAEGGSKKSGREAPDAEKGSRKSSREAADAEGGSRKSRREAADAEGGNRKSMREAADAEGGGSRKSRREAADAEVGSRKSRASRKFESEEGNGA